MNLDAWLDYIQTLHPREIELGLDRVRQVAFDLGIEFPKARIVTVAGTNGKGSAVALIEAILRSQGLRTGTYTSPHLHRFNERIRIDAAEVADSELCAAFERVEAGRGATALTYFEFGTLAALLLFQEAVLDVLLLEVGLGGRLDAVNILDADVAVITSVDLDHQAWLGTDRETIGIEKAGILRAGRPAVLAERDPPRSVLEAAAGKSVPVLQLSKDFDHTTTGTCWHWRGSRQDGSAVQYDNLRVPLLNPDLAAAALQASLLLLNNIEIEPLSLAMGATTLAGRFELMQDRELGTQVLFDVAHNPAAAALLARRLAQYRQDNPGLKRVVIVIAMMADKDVRGFVGALDSIADIWYIAQVNQARCMPADNLARQLESVIDSAKIVVNREIRSAYEAACRIAGNDGLVLVTGSFYTVSELRGGLIHDDGRP